MRVVLSVGGSVLAPNLDPDRVNAYGGAIAELADEHEVGVVVGGGSVAREYIETARRLGENEMALDRIGIAVTRLNARLLIAALGEAATVAPPEDYEAAATALRDGTVPVMGGVAPAQTTDAVSAVLAEFVDADLLVYATSVPGVFDADPAEDETAERFETMSPGELIELVARRELAAGSNTPVDVLAAKVIQRAAIETIVLDGTEPGAVVDAIRSGEFDGTTIRPDGGAHRGTSDVSD